MKLPNFYSPNNDNKGRFVEPERVTIIAQKEDLYFGKIDGQYVLGQQRFGTFNTNGDYSGFGDFIMWENLPTTSPEFEYRDAFGDLLKNAWLEQKAAQV